MSEKYIKEFVVEEIIEPAQEGSYISVPFEVPEDVEEINIHIQVENSEQNIVDLGMEDPFCVRGWSGGAKRSIFLREDRATPGYDLDVIYAGEWSVLLNAYKIKETCKVTIKVTLDQKHERWLKGDLHMHTNHSDGVYTVNEVMHFAIDAGLDFIALTDHNTFSQNKLIDTTLDLAVIAGVELTTNQGHCNFYGIEKPFTDFRCQTKEDVKRVIDEGEQNNALVSVNHPHCDFCAWEWQLDFFDFKVMEIWNGPWRASNKRALDWWQKQLENGKKIIAIGGSDKHGPHQYIKYGGPTTYVKARTNDTAGILNGIKSGSVSILSDPEAKPVQFSLNGEEIGGTIKANSMMESLLLECVVSDANEETVRIYSEEGLHREIILGTGQQRIKMDVPTQARFYRVELWREEIEPKGMYPLCKTNPIFIESSK